MFTRSNLSREHQFHYASSQLPCPCVYGLGSVPLTAPSAIAIPSAVEIDIGFFPRSENVCPHLRIREQATRHRRHSVRLTEVGDINVGSTAVTEETVRFAISDCPGNR